MEYDFIDMTSSSPSPTSPCPCGRSGSLAECCGPFVTGERSAPDPESLMRSRYTAFAMGTAAAIEYLVETHHPEHRAADLRAGLRGTVASVEAWEGLRVVSSGQEGDRGEVRFVAAYRMGGQRMELREHSEFVREGDRWLYVRGTVG